MDDHRQARVATDGRPKKSASAGPSSSLPAPNSSKQTKFSKWSQNSKFNKILTNIERSILAQFNGSSANDHQTRSHRVGEQPPTVGGHASSNSNSRAIVATKSANKLSSVSLEQRSMIKADATATTNQMDRVTSELKSHSQATPAGKNGKMILNKYQQQIVAAMQTSKNRPAAAVSGSCYSHDRLSIPPPHANDEARNQNHRLLFGCPRTQQADLNSTNDQMTQSSIYEHGGVSVSATNIEHGNFVVDHHPQQPAPFYHNSSSPASSAQSLPASKPGFLQAPQNGSRLSALDDEESGFCTYQSRRSALNNPPSQVPSNEFNKTENHNMILQQNLLGSENFTKMGSNNITPQQQQMIINHHNLLQKRITQQQSINNARQQHQLNQVPIPHGVMYNNNLHIQHQVNMQQNINRLGDSINQTYGSYNHLGPVPSSQIPIQQPQFHPQPLYDGQIYANAPPKPRRYQYYDQSLSVNPQQVNLTRTSQYYSTPPSHPTQYPGQQISIPPGRQFPYNIVGEQVQAYNQQHGQLMNGFQLPHRPQRQLPVLPPPPTLMKSKSSLDVADLSRFKQDGIQADGILRVQPKSSNAPIYGSTRMINQIESSALQRNQNYRPQISVYYQHQHQQKQQQLPPPPTNLQRSKSIGNLLPNHSTNELNMTQRQLAPFFTSNHLLQQPLAPIHSKFLTVSSASTNNLNHVGLSNSSTMFANNSIRGLRPASQVMQQTTRPDNNNVESKTVNSIQKQHPQPYTSAQNAPLPPIRQSCQRPVNGDALWSSQQQNKSTTYNNCDGQTTKANTKTISNSGKIVRQSQNGNASSNSVPPAEGSGSVAQSLDDKIRHLLISDDCANGSGGANSNNKAEFRIDNAAWPVQPQSHLQIPLHTQLSQKEAGIHSLPIPGESKSIADRQQNTTWTNNSDRDGQLVREQVHHSGSASTSMGNRHQRQYQVNGANLVTLDQQTRASQRHAGNQCDSMSINSQLIVDLTTPRVLATTQTTLLPSTSLADQTQAPQQFKSQEAWSMNQLGLPTRYVDQFALNTLSDTSNNDPIPEATRKVDAATNTSSFPAPYYYSDLKSEEQRRALLNIVQQKSLSPPPQLLSRSIDQSATRLAPKSATMHASQARMLSETLAASQRRLQSKGPFPDSKSTSNIPGESSDSSVTKNIDKLFESPVDPQLNQTVGNKLHPVRSMLALSTDPPVEESSSAISRVPSDQTQIESMSNSSGYCSDAWKKAGSKSKSLENINQQQEQSDVIDEPLEKSTFQDKLKRFGNPVYENIRRSDKLLSAINNSTTCLSTSSTRNRKSRNGLPPARPQPASCSDSMDDEDDFVEFLSTEVNSSNGRSQFDSSQFSASDFNNSSSSGSTSESSHSGSVTTDSLDISSPNSKSKLTANQKKSVIGGGILKSAFKTDDKSTMRRETNDRTNDSISNDDGGQIHQNNNNNIDKDRDDKPKGENKFKNVLGNVIDVDVYPVNMNPPSPVGNNN